MPKPRKTSACRHCNTIREPDRHESECWAVVVCVKCGKAHLEPPLTDLPFDRQWDAAGHLAEFANLG